MRNSLQVAHRHARRERGPDGMTTLMPKQAPKKPPKQTTGELGTHVAAKIVLIGDGGVGKTTLGRWLAYGAAGLKGSLDHERIWHLPKLGGNLSDGTKLDPVLWDFEGHADQRLILPLWLADADSALLLFDPTPKNDPLAPVVYWLEVLARQKETNCRKILVGTRVDRGTPTLIDAEIQAFCHEWKIEGGYVATSTQQKIGLKCSSARSRRFWTGSRSA